MKIKSNFTPNFFEFKKICVEDVRKYVLQLDKTKRTSGGIPTNILQGSLQTTAPLITQIMIETSLFPEDLKLAEVKPIKKGSTADMGNYRPISLLPTFSKVFERILYDQLSDHFQGLFSPLLCGFRKGHSTHHALLKILLNWQKSLDNKGVVGAVLMDLSKAFDTLPHDLLIAKLACYGLSKPSLNLIHSFLITSTSESQNWRQV